MGMLEAWASYTVYPTVSDLHPSFALYGNILSKSLLAVLG
jgi:hypothetical protein